MIVWREGEFTTAADAISADDRGYLIGEAIFETLLVDDGTAAFLEAHIERMRRGCAAFGMARALDATELGAVIRKTAARNDISGRAVCRMTLSRSGGPRGLGVSPQHKERLMIALSPAPAPPAFIRLKVSEHRRFTLASTNAFKCAGAYAENILARSDAARAGADEAVMLNEHGHVACASSSNIFAIVENRLFTPPPEEGAMPGVTRAVLIEEARRIGVEVVEAPLALSVLRKGAILLTNSVAGPVRSALDDEKMAGEGGALVDRLIDAYARRLAAEFAAAARRENT